MKEGLYDFKGFFEYHPVPSWIYDAAKNEIVELNQAAVKRYGYSREEFQQLVFSNLTAVLEQQTSTKSPEQHCLGQFTHSTKTGEPVLVNLYASWLPSEHRNHYLLTAVEISNREEQRLRLLESVITHTNDAVVITEAEPTPGIGLKIVYVNEAFTRMTGYTSEEVMGRSPALLQGPDTNKEELKRLAEAINNWTPCEVTLLNYKKSGEPFWLNFTIIPVPNSTGWFTHWIAIERDVTAQAKKEQEYELTLKISQFFNQATDLNSMLEQLCQAINSDLDCSFAEVWLPTAHNDKLHLYVCHAATTPGKLFYQETSSISRLELLGGFPGTIWATQQPLLLNVAADELPFMRREAAMRAGIRWMAGTPLFFNKMPVAVLIAGTITGNGLSG